MNTFVLDNSVTMRWLMATPKAEDQQYAEQVLQSMLGARAHVPNLWHLEVANVLRRSEKQQIIRSVHSQGFLIQLQGLPVVVDDLTYVRAFSRTYDLAESLNLSSYDAAYLELAIRLGAPLATLDKDLTKAAKACEVKLYLTES